MSVPESIIDSQISVKEVKAYVYNLLEKKLSATIYFHTLDHTERVYRAVKKISKAEKIPKAERYLLYIAALFNDAGFSISYTNHEEESALLAHKYLRDKNFTERQLRIIDRLINSTKSGVAPVTKLQKILCDANVAYVGDVEYFYYADLLRKEREHNEEDYSPTDLQWAEENLQFLQQHYFFSRAATKLYQENKLKNIRKARKSLKKELAIEKAKWENFSVAKNKAALTMFKTALRNHIDLTAIADQKSNMMLSVNAFLLTIGLPIFASYLTEKVYLLVPSILFMFTCVITMIYATLATDQ